MYPLWLIMIFVASECVGEDLTADTTSSVMEIHTDCINCRNDAPDLNEFLQSQKIAHRLEYIRKQIINNLHVENPPKEPPKLDSIPDFLIDRFINPAKPTERSDDDVSSNQIVLFPEDVSRNCLKNSKNTICLNFKLSDKLMESEISSASFWVSQEQISSKDSTPSISVTDLLTITVKNRDKKPVIQEVKNEDGWYQIDAKNIVKSWQIYKNIHQRVLVVTCSSCQEFSFPVNSTKSKTPFLLLRTETEDSPRSKRGVNCVPGQEECCREDLWIDFQTLSNESKFIYKPEKFNAYVCRGNCYFHSATDSHNPYASILVKYRKNQVPVPTACCTPTKFGNLPIFYQDSNSTLVVSKIPNVIVESCGCI